MLTTPNRLMLWGFTMLLLTTPAVAKSQQTKVVTIRSGETIVFLEMARRTYAGKPEASLDLAYWVEAPPGDLKIQRVVDAERARCARIFESLRVWSEYGLVRRVSVTGVSGEPGREGRFVAEVWEMKSTSWERQSREVRRGIVRGQFTAIRGLEDQAIRTGAIAKALSFLASLDAGRTREAWEFSAGGFKAAVPLERLERLTRALKNLGGNRSREVALDAYSVPSEQWNAQPTSVAVRFVSRSALGEVSEEVVLTMDKGGGWQVAGYEPKFPIDGPR